MSLRSKMLAGVILVMTLVGGLLTANLVADGIARRSAQASDKAEFLARLAADWVEHTPSLRTTDWASFDRRLSTSPLVSGWLVVARGRDGSTLSIETSSGDRDLGVEEEAVFRGVFADKRVRVLGTRAYAPLATGEGDHAVRLDLRGHEIAGGFDLTQSLGNIVVIMVLGTVILVLLTWVLLQRVVLRPLQAILDASRRVSEGDYSGRVPAPVGRKDEISELIAAMNSMMEKIEAYHQRLKEDIRQARERITHTERILVHAQRLSATGTLAAGIAHEINNPLGGMLNALQALKSGKLDPAKREEYLDLVQDGLERVRKIVGQVLHFRPRAFEPVPVSPREVVEKSMAFLDHKARRKEVAVENALPADLPAIQGDALELQQAILNVLMNAVDACAAGSGRVRVGHEIGEGVIRILIVDNGIGMSAEELARCMDPFFTTKDQGEGTGLGLAVAGSIVDNHGGKLSIASRKGEGTTVTLEFPVRAP